MSTLSTFFPRFTVVQARGCNIFDFLPKTEILRRVDADQSNGWETWAFPISGRYEGKSEIIDLTLFVLHAHDSVPEHLKSCLVSSTAVVVVLPDGGREPETLSLLPKDLYPLTLWITGTKGRILGSQQTFDPISESDFWTWSGVLSSGRFLSAEKTYDAAWLRAIHDAFVPEAGSAGSLGEGGLGRAGSVDDGEAKEYGAEGERPAGGERQNVLRVASTFPQSNSHMLQRWGKGQKGIFAQEITAKRVPAECSEQSEESPEVSTDGFDFDCVVRSRNRQEVRGLFTWSFSVDVQPVFLDVVRPDRCFISVWIGESKVDLPQALSSSPSGHEKTREAFDLGRFGMVKAGETIAIHGAQHNVGAFVRYLRFGWTTG